jgi:threonine/homoserine/homoserine lactone efflux protein
MQYNFIGYLIFAFVTSITPGPNNLTLLSYGKAYGFTDSGKVMLGIMLGFLTELILAGYGVAGIISANPNIEIVLKVVGSVWLFYLAFILKNMHTDTASVKSSKVGFVQMLIQQFVNPKAWIMAITGAGAFMPQLGNIHLNVMVYALIFGIVGTPSMIIWLKMGDVIAKLFVSKQSNIILGYSLFLLMMVSIASIWL